MTTINIAGPITEIEIGTYAAVSTVVLTTTNLPPWNAPITISPSGSPVTVLLVDSSALYGLGLGAAYFALSASFNVGDVVEVYNKPGTSVGANPIVSDEYGNNENGPVYRKVLTGTSRNWVTV